LLAVAAAGAWLWFSGGVGEVGAPGGVAGDAMQTGGAVVGGLGLARVFVLFAYGGWNEAAYLSAEVRPPQRNIALALILGVGGVTVIYSLVNVALLVGLGQEGMARSEAVAADLLRMAVGEGGAAFVSILVVVAALGTANATIITGGRSNFALGLDFPRLFGFMGRWKAASSVPVPALLVQGAISLLLIVGAPLLFEEGGVEAMVAYTAPVFWFFFFLVGLSVIVLRSGDPDTVRQFRTPLYPLPPILFCVVCLYMLFSAITYAGAGSLLGVGVLLAGVPLLLFARRRPH
jgi:amino acid transporter